jgi:hypothetical protein
MEPNQPNSLFEMQADGNTQTQLNSISKWGKFISITGLIFAAFFLLLIAVKGEEIVRGIRDLISLGNNLAGILIGIIVVLGLLCLAWLYFLLRACVLIRQALISKSSDQLAEGFKAFKNFFIIGIIFSILSILGSLTGMINS